MAFNHELTLDSSRLRIERIPRRLLPYKTKSICPECLFSDKKVNVVIADILEESDSIVMKKSCEKHGDFSEIIWSDIKLWNRINNLFYKSIGLDNPRNLERLGCPMDCGICNMHNSHTALGLIDVTLRCNLNCPICFANSSKGPTDDPSSEDIDTMLQNLRNNTPIRTPGIQFAGGEPTISNNLPSYIKKAKNLGFNHIMVATNGVRFANEPEYVKSLVDSGLNTVYLQFDGVTEKPYIEARGVDLRRIKEKAIANCSNAGLDGVILVPTVVKGINDDQLGEIIRFALERKRIIKCVNFQPVSFTGRINHEDRTKMRITIPEVIHAIKQQTNGLIQSEDWYPISSMLPLGRALGLLKGKPYLELSAHPACGVATFLIFDLKGRPHPITKVLDLDEFRETLEEVCELYSKRKLFAGIRSRIKIASQMRHIKQPWAVKHLMMNLLRNGDYDSLASFMGNVVMLGMMHFMDPYNLDLERVKYCDITYSTMEGLIPFCTQNIIHRYVST